MEGRKRPALIEGIFQDRIERENVVRLFKVFGDALRAGAKWGREEKFFNSFAAGYLLIRPEAEEGKKLIVMATEGAHHDSEVVAGFLNGIRVACKEGLIVSGVEIRDTGTTVGYRFE